MRPEGRRGAHWRLALLMGMAAGLGLLAAGVGAQERAGDVVWGAFSFGQVHGVMQSLEDEIEGTLRAFLHADTATVDGQAEIIITLMGEVLETFPKKKPEVEVEVWQAAWDISKDARMMQSNIRKGDYRGAYRSFSSLTNRCLVCHQQRRVEGRFTMPEDLGQPK